MKESIGNAFVFGAFTIFAFLTLLILNSAINYSRASKIKNRLVSYVETYAENNLTSQNIDFGNDEDFQKEVNNLLSSVGYRTHNDINYSTDKCPDLKDGSFSIQKSASPYDYCIYAYQTSRGYFYKIVTYMYFDIPIIGEALKFPISGETRTIYSLGER